MTLYENIFIARPEISSVQVEALTEHLINILTENSGKAHHYDYWGLKPLAYEINKNKKGHYVLIEIEAPHSAIAEMERMMKINEDIIRFLTVKVEKFSEKKEKDSDKSEDK